MAPSVETFHETSLQTERYEPFPADRRDDVHIVSTNRTLPPCPEISPIFPHTYGVRIRRVMPLRYRGLHP